MEKILAGDSGPQESFTSITKESGEDRNNDEEDVSKEVCESE
jgi:hypothetical protein